MNLQKGTTDGFKGNAVPYLLIGQEDASERLAIVLPGAGYTAQAPLLHYATDIYLQKGYDVLNVNYRYNDPFYDDFTMEELSEAIRFDVAAIIEGVIADSNYAQFCLIGKSLGTIAMASELARPIFREAEAVWLTPLIKRPDVFEAMRELPNRALGFIGDADPNYEEERWNQLEANPQLDRRLVPGTEHSLEIVGKPLESIGILKDIMAEIQKF